MKERILSIGAILSAILSVGGCVAPLIFVTLGIGGFGFVTKFEQYRDYFIILSFCSLGFGFLFTYRKPQKVIHSSLCMVEKKTSKILLLIATIAAFIALFFPAIMSKIIYGF